MGLKKIKQVKYNGIYEYFKNSEPKKITSLYIAYRDELGIVKKVNANTTDKDKALQMLNAKKSEITKNKKTLDKEEINQKKKCNRKSFTLNEMAKMYFDGRTTKGNHDDELKYNKRISSTMLGKKKASKISTDDIIKLQTKLEKDYAPKTVNEQINSLRAMFNASIEKGWVEYNPVRRKRAGSVTGVEKIKESKENGRVLSDDELKKLWEIDDLKMNDRLMLFVKMCYYTGARPDAIMSLQVKHVNFATKRIHLKAMKGGEAYERKLTSEVEPVIREWIEKHNLTFNNYIFYPIQSYLRAETQEEKEELKNKHSNYTGYRRLIQKILDPVFNVGIPATNENKMHRIVIYSLRRTAGTNIYKKYGIKHAQKFLNHTDIVTTVKYLNIDDEMEGVEDAL